MQKVDKKLTNFFFINCLRRLIKWVFRRNVKVNDFVWGWRGTLIMTNEKGPISLKFYTLLTFYSELIKNIFCSLGLENQVANLMVFDPTSHLFLANFWCLFTFFFGLRVSDRGCYIKSWVCTRSNFSSTFWKCQLWKDFRCRLGVSNGHF